MRRVRSRAPDWEDSKGKPRRGSPARRTGLLLPLFIALAFYGLYSHAAKPASAASTRATLVASRALAAGGPRVVAPAAPADVVATTAAAPPHVVVPPVPDGATKRSAADVAVPEAHPEPAGNAAPAEPAAAVHAADAAAVDPAALATQVESARARLEAAASAKPAAGPDAASADPDPAWPSLPAESAALITSTLRDPVALSPPPGAPLAERRRLAVRAAMAHAWAGYVRYAWGADELAPLTKRGYETFCSMGATLIDAMDTLKIMGFDSEFGRAVDWVAAGEDGGLAFDRDCSVSAFEATIRVVGGLLAAADLAPASTDVLVPRAEALATRLLKAYDTPLGFPRSSINLRTGAASTPGWIGGGKAALLAEIGTVQLELLKLAEATGKRAYADAAERIVAELAARHPGEGLLPIYVKLEDAAAFGPVTMGGMSDSYYEYLLKAWLLKRGKDSAPPSPSANGAGGPPPPRPADKASLYRDMWVRAMDETLDKLVATHPVDGRMYVGERPGLGPDAKLVPKMEHLACFLPANLALGVLEGAVEGERAARYTDVAKGLTETCYRMYDSNPTGLAAEHVTFGEGAPMAAGRTARFNLLRPEAVEALVMLHRLTGEAKYQDWGWRMFTAFETVSRVATGGHSGVQDVTAGGPPLPGIEARPSPVLNDRQESFWLAESLKYFYLLFAPPDTLPLSGPGAWVLNTEAHPLKPLGAEAVDALTNEMTAGGVAGVLARLAGKPPAVASQESAPAHPESVLTRPQGGGSGSGGAAGGGRAAQPAGGNPAEASHPGRPAGHEGSALK